jgi:hypothetical protein
MQYYIYFLTYWVEMVKTYTRILNTNTFQVPQSYWKQVVAGNRFLRLCTSESIPVLYNERVVRGPMKRHFSHTHKLVGAVMHLMCFRKVKGSSLGRSHAIIHTWRVSSDTDDHNNHIPNPILFNVHYHPLILHNNYLLEPVCPD